jgi:two-component system phosphate regulon response regulator PhoB
MDVRPKVLSIASPLHKGLDAIHTHLKSHFEVQTVQALQPGLFLIKEWEPDLILLDGASEVGALQHFLRHHFILVRPAVIVFDEVDPAREELVFSQGADHLLSPKSTPQSVYWRCYALYKQRRHLKTLNPSVSAQTLTPENISLRFQSVEVFPNDFYVKRSGQIVSLTPTQFKLVHLFVTSQEQLLARETIKKVIWANSSISLRSIDAQISKLKKLLPELDSCLVNIYGKGYMLSATKSKLTA